MKNRVDCFLVQPAQQTAQSALIAFTLNSHVGIVDATTTAITSFRIADIMKIPVINAPAVSTACSGLAQFALAIVVYAGTSGIGEHTKHQQHRNNDSHPHAIIARK
ncbi:hypothetical protein [Pseudomonas lini]